VKGGNASSGLRKPAGLTGASLYARRSMVNTVDTLSRFAPVALITSLILAPGLDRMYCVMVGLLVFMAFPILFK